MLAFVSTCTFLGGELYKLSHTYIHAYIRTYIFTLYIHTVEPLQLETLWTTSKSHVDHILCYQYIRSTYT